MLCHLGRVAGHMLAFVAKTRHTSACILTHNGDFNIRPYLGDNNIISAALRSVRFNRFLQT